MDVKDFFNEHAKEYAHGDKRAHYYDLPTIINFAGKIPAERALDIATGPGFVAIELANTIKEVVGIDIADKMLEEAKLNIDKIGIKNVRLLEMDAAHLEFPDGYFDIVTCRKALHHIKDKAGVLREVNRVLKNGGYFIISDMLRPDGDNKDLFNRMERARDSTHAGAESTNGWTQILRENGFAVTDLHIMETKEKVDDWLYPIKNNGKEAKAVRDILKESEELRRAIRYNEAEDSFIKKRAVMMAQKA
jgi:ubiquinone/menaquinone biosynthesis C-methylase UbiE